MTTRPELSSWVLATRPPTLWAAIAPVLVGSSLAWRDDVFRWDACVVVAVAAVLIQIGVNFANDLSDGVRGTDNEDRIGPKRAVGSGLISPGAMKKGLVVVFGLAIACGAYLIAIAGWAIAVIGIVSIIAALAYTGGPWPYGYHALGELFVFVFFGLVATVGTRYVYDGALTREAWIGGVIMGCLATAILLANNIRDIDTDAVSGKRTLAVNIGRRPATILYGVMTIGAMALLALAAIAGVMPVWSTVAAVTGAIVAFPLWQTMRSRTEGPLLIAALKRTAGLQLLVAILVSVAALVDK